MQPGGIVERLRQLQGSELGTEFAPRAGMRPAKLSKLRLGQQLPTEDDIRSWVRAGGGSEDDEKELLAMLADADRHRTSFERALKGGQEEHQHSYTKLVEQADRVRMLERSFVPSVLQTRDYAIAVLTGSKELHHASDDVIAAVDARLERQRYLYDGKRPFEFVLDETVLTRVIGSSAIMRAQVERILAAMDLSHVEIGILPVYGAFHDVVRNSFELYGQVAVAETYADDDPLSDEKRAKYERVMDEIWQDAATGDDARALIRKAITHHSQTVKKTRRGR
jgi:hypothetical protein